MFAKARSRLETIKNQHPLKEDADFYILHPVSLLYKYRIYRYLAYRNPVYPAIYMFRPICRH